MSDLYFVRPTGASADTAELEYLTALHQSEPNHVRSNATVSSLDILRFLRSRFNISVTHEQALYIVRGLSGDAYQAQRPTRRRRQEDGEMPELGSDPDEEAQEIQNEPLKQQENEQQSEGGDDDTSTADEIVGSLREALKRLRKKSQADILAKMSIDEAGGIEGEIMEEYLDLVQILSILLIPCFARLDKEGVVNTQRAGTAERLLESERIILEMQARDNVGFKNVWRVLRQKIKRRYDDPLPTPDFISPAIEHMLRDFPPEQHTITAELIEYLLLKYGLVDRASDKGLVRTMTEMAKSYSACGALTPDAVLQCAVSDLGPWDVESERSLSSFFFDVFGEQDPSKLKCPTDTQEQIDSNSVKDDENPSNVPTKKLSLKVDTELSNIDLVTDTHFSLFVAVLIWVFFFITIATYGSKVLHQIQLKDTCPLQSKFWCHFMSAIASWLTLAIIFSVFGLIQVAPLSIGNHPFSTSRSLKLVAALCAIAYSLIPYFATSLTDEPNGSTPPIIPNNAAELPAAENETGTLDGASSLSVNTGGNDTRYDLGRDFADLFIVMCLTVGLFLGAVYFVSFLLSSFGALKDRVLAIFPNDSFVSHAIRGHTSMKRAAHFKLTKLLIRAYMLHDPNASKYFKTKKDSVASISKDDPAMKNFVLYGDQNEFSGGVMWTFKRLLSRNIFDEEGVWVSSRLVFIQCGQISLSIVFVGALFKQTPVFEDYVQEAKDALPDGLPSWVYDMVPDPWMIRTSLYPALICAGFVCVGLVILYIPSTVATILKFRGQLKPSLGNPSFLAFRNAVDTTYMNLSNAVYGLVAAAGLWYVTVGAIIFLYVWPVTQQGVVYFTAWLLGLGVTIGLKMAMTMICQKVQYRAFFRIRPRAARISSLALECWFIGLGSSVLITRLGQFLGAAFFWIGRIDVPFLAQDVSLVGISLDMVPTYFVKDILVHESHKHPYMERLARLYVMKAHHGEDFVTRAGAAWRQLIVLAFMPWVARYHVYSSERHQQALESLRRRTKLKVEPGKNAVAEEL